MEGNGDKIETDENMRALIEVLNELPGISTYSSCGGHESPEPGQVADGEFQVSIEADGIEAFHSLGIIAYAAQELSAGTDESTYVELAVWSSTDNPAEAGEAVAFDLSGVGVHPDALAKAIRDLG